MQYRMLGKTGLKVSVLGFGGIPIQRGSATEAAELLGYLAEAGVNFIDTARGYTVSEQYIGAALQGELRSRFVLATKSMSRDYDSMMRDIDASLKDLRTDHIELYQMHNLKPAEFELAFSEKGAVAAIQDAIRAGKVGHMGASAHLPTALELLLDRPEIETVMFPMNIVENQGAESLQRAMAQQVGFIAMKPLAGGNLADVRLAVRYLMTQPGSLVAIPGMGSVQEARELLAAAQDTSPLTSAELAAIEQVRTELGGTFCRRCSYCLPCPQGIDIPSCFTFKNYVEHYDLADWAKGRYLAMAAKAGDCIGCGQCETRCPYELPIREKLRATKEVFGA